MNALSKALGALSRCPRVVWGMIGFPVVSDCLWRLKFFCRIGVLICCLTCHEYQEKRRARQVAPLPAALVDAPRRPTAAERASEGANYEATGETRNAISSYSQALALEPTHLLSLFRLSHLHRNDGRLEVAVISRAAKGGVAGTSTFAFRERTCQNLHASFETLKQRAARSPRSDSEARRPSKVQQAPRSARVTLVLPGHLLETGGQGASPSRSVSSAPGRDREHDRLESRDGVSRLSLGVGSLGGPRGARGARV